MKIKYRPEKYRFVSAFFGGLMGWFRVPYNMLNGVSFRRCCIYESEDLWNVGLKYKQIEEE